MDKKEDISLKITNNTTFNQNVVLFPFSGVNDFDFNQNEAYSYFLDNDELAWQPEITIEQRLKGSSGSFTDLVIPYVQTSVNIGNNMYLPEFISFLNNWLQQNDYGTLMVLDALNKFNIYSSKYEYGNFNIPTQ